MSYREVEGDLVKLAIAGEFEVIAHGCNCFCTMGAGIAPLFAKYFNADKFPLEHPSHRANYNKMGCIDSQLESRYSKPFHVVNAYTQFSTGASYGHIPLDYDALTLCLRKINKVFEGKTIGLPKIGCGLAGGNWEIVKALIQKELKSMDVVVVNFNPLRNAEESNHN